MDWDFLRRHPRLCAVGRNQRGRGKEMQRLGSGEGTKTGDLADLSQQGEPAGSVARSDSGSSKAQARRDKMRNETTQHETRRDKRRRRQDRTTGQSRFRFDSLGKHLVRADTARLCRGHCIVQNQCARVFRSCDCSVVVCGVTDTVRPAQSAARGELTKKMDIEIGGC